MTIIAGVYQFPVSVQWGEIAGPTTIEEINNGAKVLVMVTLTGEAETVWESEAW